MSLSSSALASLEEQRSKQTQAANRKKRLSSGRALTDVTGLLLNDDESEKAALRAQKARAAEAAQQAPAPAPIPPVGASANGASAASKRKSMGPVGAKLAVAASSIAPSSAAAAKPRKPMEAAEWKETMKLASSGKFSSKNIALVWGSDLINQMRDLLLGPGALKSSGASSASFLFDGDMDSSAASAGSESSSQFQKASCTLDASMMIYASRVDDVHKSTFRVLGGLSNQAVSAVVQDDDEDDDGKDGEGAEQALDENGNPIPVVKEKKKKLRRVLGAGSSGSAATLEPAPSKLDAKLLETHTEPDPLFALTTAKFEGGAQGMLMNNLAVYNGARIALDSAEEFVLDPVSNTPWPRLSAASAQGDSSTAAAAARAETQLRLDLDFSVLGATLSQALKDASLDEFAETRLCAGGIEALLAERAKITGEEVEVEQSGGKKGKAAAAAAMEFDFAAVVLPPAAPAVAVADDSAMADFPAADVDGISDANDANDGAVLPVLAHQMDEAVAALAQERALEAALQEDLGGHGGFDADDHDDDDDDTRSQASGSSASAASSTGRRTVARASFGTGTNDGEEELDVLDCLGEGVSNWAGIKHWKFKAKPSSASLAGAVGKAGAAGKKKRATTKRGHDALDFASVALNAPAALCAPAASLTTLRLPASEQLLGAWERRAREHALRLPDDRFYRVRNLQTLCQKPGVLVKLRSAATSSRRAAAAAAAAGGSASAIASPARSSDPSSSEHAAVAFVASTPAPSLLDVAGLAGPGVGNSPLGGLLAGQDHQQEEAKLGALQFDDDDDGHENEPASYGDYGGQGGMEDEDGDVDPATGAPVSSLILPAPLRAERIEIGYARVSKKVDVKALKQTMWTALAPALAVTKPAAAAPAPAAAPSTTFLSAISRTQSLARGELAGQLPQITPSYFFISLLHLCNEHGLKLEDGPERQKNFGDFAIVQQ